MYLIQKEIHILAKEIALKENLPVTSVTEIITSQFDYVRSEISKGNPDDPDSYRSVLLKYLGTFKFNKAKLNRIKEGLKKKGNKNA